jgi:hypothetical protein
VRRSFSAHTNMTWMEFVNKAHQHFDVPRAEVSLGYRLNGDTRMMSYLSCESEWNAALARLKEKVLAARTRAVTMELKNMVSVILSNIEKNSQLHIGRCQGARARHVVPERREQNTAATMTSPRSPRGK